MTAVTTRRSKGGCALASSGFLPEYSPFYDENTVGETSKVTFAGKAKFKDNSCDGDYPSIYDDGDFPETEDNNKGGGALLAYGDTSIEFADTAVFKRNKAPKGGAIVNTASISFISDAKLFTADNVATGTCRDIQNNDVGRGNGVGIVVIGPETITGPSAGLCERSAA